VIVALSRAEIPDELFSRVTVGADRSGLLHCDDGYGRLREDIRGG